MRGAREVRLTDGRTALLRAARPRDARALARLLDAVAAEPRSGLLMKPGDRDAGEWRRSIAAAQDGRGALFLVAEVGGRLAGDLNVRRAPSPASRHVCVIGMSVAAWARGVGLGGALLEQALEWAAAARFEKVTLSVLGHNRDAVRFYERHGFAREGTRSAQFVRDGQYSDEVLMARFLTTS